MAHMNKWNSGLYDCCNDCSSCCMVTWCPCVAHGMIDNAVSGGGECVGCCLFFMMGGCSRCCLSPCARSNLRKKYSLMEAPCGDCCVHFWCSSCAQCQEIRELKARGALATAGKPNHVGPTYSHSDGPSSPANQQLLPQHGAAGGPVGMPPEYERVPQAAIMNNGAYQSAGYGYNQHPGQSAPYPGQQGCSNPALQPPQQMHIGAPPVHPVGAYPQNTGHAPQYGAAPVPVPAPISPFPPAVVPHYPMM